MFVLLSVFRGFWGRILSWRLDVLTDFCMVFTYMQMLVWYLKLCHDCFH